MFQDIVAIFAGDTFKCIFFKEKFSFFIQTVH